MRAAPSRSRTAATCSTPVATPSREPAPTSFATRRWPSSISAGPGSRSGRVAAPRSRHPPARPDLRRSPEGDRLQGVDLAGGRVLPDLEHGRADVAVTVEVDRAEGALVIDLLACADQLDRLLHLKVGDLDARRAGHPDEIRLDLRRRRRARPQRCEECDVLGVERRAFETGVRLRARYVLLPVRRERRTRR